MKSTGIVRKVDSLGRIVLPMELRRTLNIKGADGGLGTPLEIYVEGENIVLRKHNPGCECCGETTELRKVLGINVCPKCLREFEEASKAVNKINV